MAISSSAESVNTVLSIDTSKSASSMKELRTQIKELKDELVGLDSESQEYADTLVVLGEKSKQFKEINEEINRTNTEWDTTLGHVTNVLGGGIAAVQGLTAGLSFLGVEMGEDDELTQSLVKSMSMLQAVNSMKPAIDSFKTLATQLKTNIALTGSLGNALRKLALDNPFTAILMAVVAVSTAVTKVINLIGEAKDAHIQLQLAAQNKLLQESYDELAVKLNNQIELMKIAGKTDYEVFQRRLQNAKQLRDEAEKNYYKFFELSQEGNKRERKKAEEMVKIWGDALTERQKEYQALIDSTEVEEAKAKKTAEEKNKTSKVERDLEKEKYDLALKRLELQRTLAETESQAKYEEEKRAAQGNAQTLLDIDKKYQEERKKLNEQYYNSAIALAENFRSTRKKDSDIVGVNQTIANLNKSLQEGADAWEDYKTENAAANIELAKTKIDAQADLDSLNRRTEAMTREIEITRAHNERYLELVQQKWVLQADLDAEAIRYQQEQLQNSNIEIEADLDAMKTKHEAEMELLQEQYEQRLIAEEEFQQRKAELEAQYDNESTALLQQHFENEVALDELAVEANRNKNEKKKQQDENYLSAFSSISASITAVLNEAAQAEGVSFEEQKRFKIASTIITTLEAGMLAMKDMMEAGGPWGVAAGAIAMAATIATGMMQVNKIKQTKPGSSGASSASASPGAVTTVQSPAQIVNLNAVNDEIELPDQRVYVLESDITDAQDRVAQVETNSTF